MAKDRHTDITEALNAAVDTLEMDGVLYRLSVIAVERRTKAFDGTNKSEQRYWQRVVELLGDATEQCSEIEG